MKRVLGLIAVAPFVLSACTSDGEQAVDVVPTPTTRCLPPDCVEIVIDGLDYAFNPPTITTRAGAARVVLRNLGQKVHNLKVQGGAVEARTLNLAPGATGFLDVTLEARRYDIFCTITGHAERGMRGVLTVTP
ncbi:MAG: hypothetical protein KatS3mg060_3160 [Dehalococcoidia bacterium]|nr:MAG: hypothetical protein KatS3mg060_3160 [Dehalococcoidia bacterium]